MSIAPVLPELTVEGAERLSERISARLDAIATNYEAMMPLLREAYNRNAFAALGYVSHGAYVKDRFGNTLAKLDPDTRRVVVREMSNQGMSTRAIAPVFDVNNATISRDLARVADATPAPTDVPDLPVDASTGEVYEADDELPPAAEVALPRPVVGLDGKNYTAPAPRPLKAVPTGEEAHRLNAEQGASELARAVFTLAALDFTEHRARLIEDWWPNGKDAVSPADQERVTPKMFRLIAAGLTQLAYEWENPNV